MVGENSGCPGPAKLAYPTLFLNVKRLGLLFRVILGWPKGVSAYFFMLTGVSPDTNMCFYLQ